MATLGETGIHTGLGQVVDGSLVPFLVFPAERPPQLQLWMLAAACRRVPSMLPLGIGLSIHRKSGCRSRAPVGLLTPLTTLTPSMVGAVAGTAITPHNPRTSLYEMLTLPLLPHELSSTVLFSYLRLLACTLIPLSWDRPAPSPSSPCFLLLFVSHPPPSIPSPPETDPPRFPVPGLRLLFFTLCALAQT